MKKSLIFLYSLLLAGTVVFGACSNSGGSGNETEGKETSAPTETVKGAEEIIKEAENTAHLSGDADEDVLYNAGSLPFGSTVPAFLQTHSPDEFPAYDGDGEFFVPASDDYLMASFEEGKTAIYEFFHDGSLLAVRGRTVYDSEEALLQDNADAALRENEWNDRGYTYRENVLYSVLSEEAVFAMSARFDKFALLKAAASGAWDGDLYWFSKPYDDPISSFDSEKWDEVLTVLEREMPNHDEEEPGISPQIPRNFVKEETVRTLFTELMEKNGKSPEDFEESELRIVMSREGAAYASLLCYTVPEDYVPGGKIENFLVSAAVSCNEDTGEWEIADQKAFFAESKDEYYEKVLTEEAVSAYRRGAFVKRLWVPFKPADPILPKGIVFGKVIEVYEAEDGELGVTVFFSNGTGQDAVITKLDSLALTSPEGTVAEVGADLDIELPAGEFMYETLLIPAKCLTTPSFTDVAVRELLFSVEE